jgi:hypothetical protein
MGVTVATLVGTVLTFQHGNQLTIESQMALYQTSSWYLLKSNKGVL